MQDENRTKGTAGSNPNSSQTQFPSSTGGANPTIDGPKKSRKRIIAIIIITILALVGASYVVWHHFHQTKPVAVVVSTNTSSTSQAKVSGLVLDPNKNYGNKYANGVLPVGDGKYTTNSAKKGYVDACSQYAQNLANESGGAMTAGPWFMNNNTEYNINKKAHVEGSVSWNSSFSIKLVGGKRIIYSNNLPKGATTGIFPIQSTDPAYQYDRNPNSILSQNFTYNLSANPTYSTPTNCESGQVGVMLNGVALFNSLDAGGRDAGAWEVQDNCDGHPQNSGIYHYHTLSSCVKDISVHTVIGYALDGFPITGPQVGTNNILTTSDLDECHGIESSINLNGKNVTMYHYVMTQDFPYSVSCFRGTAITPPGQGGGQQQGGQQTGPNGAGGQGQGPPSAQPY